MTSPDYRQTVGPAALYRWLARRRRSTLTLGYVVIAGCSIAMYVLGSTYASALLRLAGALIALVATSILFAVVTWYRHEETINAAIFLAVAWALASVAGAWLAAPFLAIQRGSGVWLVAFGGLFALPVTILVTIFAALVLVSAGRRFRRYFAPSTVTDHPADPGSAA